MIGWALLAGLAALAAAPFAVEWRKPPMSDARRATAPGHFARLSRGGTHYRWYGDRTEGPVAVCVHGLTTPSFVWDGVAADMVAHGWRVLAFDLYGRAGPTGRRARRTGSSFSSSSRRSSATRG